MPITALLANGVIPVGHGAMGVSAAKLDLLVAHGPQLVRTGGVLRYKAGTQRAGQIFAHLRDFSEVSRNGAKAGQLMVQSAAGMSKLALGLTGIGAVASVANLAVSSVGFYIMNKKLNALQNEMKNTQSMLRSGFDGIERRFVQVEHLLIGLKEGQTVTWRKLDELTESVEDTKEILDATESGKLYGIFETLSEYEQHSKVLKDNQVDDFQQVLKNLRHRNRSLVESWCLGDRAVDSSSFARGTGYLQEWGTALIVEARLLRKAGDTERAVGLLRRELSDWYFPVGTKVADRLLGDHAGILLAAPFENRVSIPQYLALEAFRREEDEDVSKESMYLAEADEIQAEFYGRTPKERLKNLRMFDARPDYARAAQAMNIRELGYRMASMAVDYEMCAQAEYTMEFWDEVTFETTEEVVLMFAE